MKFRNFRLWLRRTRSFMVRNMYTLSIVFCLLVGVAMVATTVIVSNNRNKTGVVVPVNTNDEYMEAPSNNIEDESIYPVDNEPTIPVDNNDPIIPVDNEGQVVPVEDPDDMPVVPVVSNDVVIFDSPLDNYTIGMEYARDRLIWSKTLKQWQTHDGVDMLAQDHTPVKAVYDGTIERIENDILEGYCITIKHSDNLRSIYKSLSSEIVVQEGDEIKKGDVIGYVSTSAISEQKEGPHLHFEVMEGENYVDPLKYFASETK